MATKVTIQPGPVTADQSLTCASDKSLTHRALMFAAMAAGRSRVERPLGGEDCLATRDIFSALGVKISGDPEGPWEIHSPGIAKWTSPNKILDCKNSGTTARLLTGLFAAVPGLEVSLIGDDSLSQRPMGRVVRPLQEMGADIRHDGENILLPLTIRGKKLCGGQFLIDKASAQVKSALLLAATQGTEEVIIRLPLGARDHTEQILKRMGGHISVVRSASEEVITFKGPFEAKPFHWTIPVDPSSAAFFAVLGLIQPMGTAISLPEVLQNDTRLGFVKVLQRMTSQTRWLAQAEHAQFVEPVGTLKVRGGIELNPVEVSAGEIPTLVDEVPVLAVAAAFAKGTSRFYGLAELRVKESDRLAKTVELLTAAGIEAHTEGDDLIVKGGADKVRAFTFNPVGDHRLAMAACILARRAHDPCYVQNPECVAVSFPNFFELLDRCR